MRTDTMDAMTKHNRQGHTRSRMIYATLPGKFRWLGFAAVLVVCSGSCSSSQHDAAMAQSPAQPATAQQAPLRESTETAVTLRPATHLRPATQGAFMTGVYRNLFVELGKPEAEVQQKIAHGYEQLFHGDPEQASVMVPAGTNEQGPLAYIKDIGNDDIRSEGMSYGMMIAVQLDHQQDFDALWNWAKTYMYHADPKHPVYGFFSWQMRPDGTAIDEMPAPDGEEYFATALLFAAHRWGNRQGIYDYAAEAQTLLDRMKNRQAIAGTVNKDRQTTAVALFHPEHKMVRFTPDTNNFRQNGDHTDPSYHLPAFYELWALWGPEKDRAFWAEAAKVSREYFVKVTHPKTGLAPDYANFDGTPKAASWDPNTVQFRFDAWRTAMNWAVDHAWWAKDPRQIELSNRLLAFFASHGKSYPNTFQLDGTPTSQSSSLGLTAANAVAALAASHSAAPQFVESLYQREVPSGKWRYYDGMLYMMAMLHLSGNFRVYSPSAEASNATSSTTGSPPAEPSAAQ